MFSSNLRQLLMQPPVKDSLLSYISGINMTVAKNIVSYREENGLSPKEKQLMKVPKNADRSL